jgi:glucose-6-phosphate 1-dehydrogenase
MFGHASIMAAPTRRQHEAGRAAGSRVMVEKPFGNDLGSAQQLNALMHQYFPEDAIYRVDHWLGLEPVENLMFAQQDTVEAAWRVVDPVLGNVVPVHPYARASWGPQEADRLLPPGEAWHEPAG